VEGTAGVWLAEAAALLGRIAKLRGANRSERRETLRDLDSLGRARWLTAFVGVAAAAWPPLEDPWDSSIADRLIARASLGKPGYLVYGDLLDAAGTRADVESDDPFSMAVALGRAAPSERVLDAVERLVQQKDAPEALGLPL